MKRILLGLCLFFLTAAIYGQNKYKYEVRAYGGLSVGGIYNTDTPASAIKIDSIVIMDGKIYYFTGGDTLYSKPPVSEVVSGSSLYHKLNDFTPAYTFTAGDYATSDSALFSKGSRCFGGFSWFGYDTLHITSMIINRITPGDSCIGNIYIGDIGTYTATDSLFAYPYHFGTYYMGTLIIPTKTDKITYGKGLWLELKPDQITNKQPWGINIQLNSNLIRK